MSTVLAKFLLFFPDLLGPSLLGGIGAGTKWFSIQDSFEFTVVWVHVWFLARAEAVNDGIPSFLAKIFCSRSGAWAHRALPEPGGKTLFWKLRSCSYEKSLFQAGAGGPFTLFAPTNSAFDLVITITKSSMWLTQWSWKISQGWKRGHAGRCA